MCVRVECERAGERKKTAEWGSAGNCRGAMIRHPNARTLAWLRAMDFLNTIDLLGKEVYPSLHCLGEGVHVVGACAARVRRVGERRTVDPAALPLHL